MRMTVISCQCLKWNNMHSHASAFYISMYFENHCTPNFMEGRGCYNLWDLSEGCCLLLSSCILWSHSPLHRSHVKFRAQQPSPITEAALNLPDPHLTPSEADVETTLQAYGFRSSHTLVFLGKTQQHTRSTVNISTFVIVYKHSAQLIGQILLLLGIIIQKIKNRQE